MGAEYLYMAVYIVFFSGVLMFFTDWETTVSFIIGAITSILCGWIGMQIAVFTNVRTAHECWKDLESGFKVAIQGGCVMGLSLVSFGVLALWLWKECMRGVAFRRIGLQRAAGHIHEQQRWRLGQLQKVHLCRRPGQGFHKGFRGAQELGDR